MKEENNSQSKDYLSTNKPSFPCNECIVYAMCNTHFFNKIDHVKKNRQMTLILELMNKCSIFKEALIETLSNELESLKDE